MVFLLLMGFFFGLANMKSTLLPNVDARQITIQVPYPGASPREVEEGIVTKIEQNIKSLDGIERMTSVSSENAAFIDIEVLRNFDTNLVLRDVKNGVDQINSFPLDMERPIISKKEYLGFAIDFALSGKTSLQQLKQQARQVEDELLGIDGISKVQLKGFPPEEMEISLDEVNLRRYNLTFDEVLAKVQQNSTETTGGKISSRREELLIRSGEKKQTAEELKNIRIRSSEEGGLVYLWQIADVQDRWEETPNRSYLNGDPAVIITVQNTIREDLLAITEKVRQYIQEFNEQHDQIQATIIQDGSEALEDRINLMVDNGVLGFVLVICILALFLNWRIAFWVGVSIPVSLGGMFMIAPYFGVTINLLSLFGMIIVIGILVDDGIVIAENIFQKYEEGLPPMKAALEGTMEVFPAVLGAIITTIAAFSGFFFIDGSLGEIGLEMAVVVIICLVFSLIECALILPAHVSHSKALRKDRKPAKITQYFNRLMQLLRDRLYLPVLRFSLAYPLPLIALCIAALLVTIGAFQGGVLRSTFFPNMPSERFFINLKMPAGSTSTQTNLVLQRVEKGVEELNANFREKNLGKGLILNLVKDIGPTSNRATMTVSLLPTEERGELTARDVSSLLRDKVGPVYEAEFLQFRAPSTFGKPVDISILGDDEREVSLVTQKIKESLKKLPKLRDVVSDNSEGMKEIKLELRPKAYHLGFSMSDIARQVRAGFFGAKVNEIQRGTDEVKIWVRYGESNRSNLSDLQNMRIRNANGQSIPLSELANFRMERGTIAINHLNGKKEVKIEAEIANSRVSISDILDEIQSDIMPPILKEHPGIGIIYNGQSREQAKTFASLQKSIAIILLIIFFIIMLTFQSVSQTFVIFAITPFGMIGIGLGHYVMDLPLSMVSALGYTALIGILVNDALVFVSTYNDKIKEGLLPRDALYETGLSRFRPIVLTSITTIVGLGPILLEKSLGAQMIIPMAVSVAFGLLIVTIIILAMIPALLQLSNDIKVYSLSLWEGKPIDPQMVEPAFPGRDYNYFVVFCGFLVAVFLFLLLFGLAVWVGDYLVTILE